MEKKGSRGLFYPMEMTIQGIKIHVSKGKTSMRDSC